MKELRDIKLDLIMGNQNPIIGRAGKILNKIDGRKFILKESL
jgi:hypothetical protein